MATRTDANGKDHVRDLNNYLQEAKKGETLTKHLSFASQQSGSNNQARHTVTYTFRNVTIGTGEDTTKAAAKSHAAEMALEYLKEHGIPE